MFLRPITPHHEYATHQVLFKFSIDKYRPTISIPLLYIGDNLYTSFDNKFGYSSYFEINVHMRVFPALKQNPAPDSMAMICTIKYDGGASQCDYIDEQSRLYLWNLELKKSFIIKYTKRIDKRLITRFFFDFFPRNPAIHFEIRSSLSTSFQISH